jgi:RNA polymerase sigma-B factor
LRRDRLVAEYWYLCRRAARKFMRSGLDRADLEQVGAIGLIKAADRYDSKQPAPFEAYAWLLIVGELMHHVRDSERVLRAPRRVRQLERRCNVVERELWGSLGREPSERDVACVAGISHVQMREVRAYRASHRPASLDPARYAGRGTQPCCIDDLLDRLTVEKLLERLNPLERHIVRAVHLNGISIVDLAARLGYSRRHVTRLHRSAMERLKGALSRWSMGT